MMTTQRMGCSGSGRVCGASGRGARPGSSYILLLPLRQQTRVVASSGLLPPRGMEASVSSAAASSSTAVEQLVTQHVSAAERLMYSLAESPSVSEVLPEVAKRAGGWLAPLSEGLESVLRVFQGGLNAAHVPYSYGFSIILLTACIKVVTYPLVKKQVESTMATQALKPRIDLLKKRFGDDKDRITKETNVLYEQAGVDPSAGCLPSLATIPVFIGLYSSLTNAAADGLFEEGFFWIPTLSGPTTVALRQAGSGTAWLYPFVDNAPPIGWDAAAPYLVIPALLLVSMYVSSAITTPPPAKDDPNANVGRVLTYGLPLMVGYFSLCVPSGLSLYYFCNSVFSTVITVYLKKFGGADVKMNELGPVTRPGSGRRMGAPVAAFVGWEPTTVVVDPKAAAAADEAAEMDEDARAEAAAALKAEEEAAAAAAAAARLDPALVSRRVKRRSLAALQESQARGARLAGLSQGAAAQASAAREEAAAREAAAAEAKAQARESAGAK